MGLVSWLIFGAFVGWIASIITKNDAEMGCVTNIAVGILGSAIGGFIAGELGIGSYRNWTFPGFAIAILGAVILLAILNFIRPDHPKKPR